MEDNERETAEGWTMINRDDIEAGDKCYTRDGGCLVARFATYEDLVIGTGEIDAWLPNGKYLNRSEPHPLDIIRIEKAPKPVVYEAFVGMNHDGGCSASSTFNAVRGCARVVKITLVNGVYDKDRSEQVK